MSSRFISAIDYAISILLANVRNAESCKKHILYAEAVPEGFKGIHIVPSGFFRDEVYGGDESIPRLPLKTVEGVPLLFGDNRIEKKEYGLKINADIIASSFFMLTRYEEMVRDQRDEYGRFPGEQSLPYRAGFLRQPIVNKYMQLLATWLGSVGISVDNLDRKPSVLLTHDIDNIRKYRGLVELKSRMGDVVKRGKTGIICQAAMVMLGFAKDPYDTFNEMAEIASKLDGIVEHESFYFFMACGKTPHDRRYDIDGSYAREAFAAIKASNGVIGLHASRGAGLEPERIEIEKKALERASGVEVRRNRHHILGLLNIEDTWALADCSIDWDSTLGYPYHPGFRLGVCQPIPLYDPVSLKPFGIEEHPLILMDGAYLKQGFSEEESYADACGLIDTTAEHGGEFVLLWHNNHVGGGSDSYLPGLYRRLVNYMKFQLV